MKLKKDEVLVIKRCTSGNTSHKDFVYPESGIVEAHDWDETPECGGGLHGWTLGFEDCYSDMWQGNFIVLLVNKKDGYIELKDKVKFRKGKVILNTPEAQKAHELMLSVYPNMKLHWRTAFLGDNEHAYAGDRSILTAGDTSALTAGDRSTLTAVCGSALTAGDMSTLTAEHFSTLTAGGGSVITAGVGSTLTAGDRSILNAEGYSTLTVGDWSTLMAGDHSTLAAGHWSQFIVRGFAYSTTTVRFAEKSTISIFIIGKPPRVYTEFENETVYFFEDKPAKRYTTTHESIDALEGHEIFVFGSNLAGRHEGGAAKVAHEKFGAEHGVGEGRRGQSYAFPTLDENMQKRSMDDLRESVKKLIRCAQKNTTKIFLLTKVGCGIAGYDEEEIKSLFAEFVLPANIISPWK